MTSHSVWVTMCFCFYLCFRVVLRVAVIFGTPHHMARHHTAPHRTKSFHHDSWGTAHTHTWRTF